MAKKKDARLGQLYNRVAVLRAERGLSRQELADAIGVNYQTIGYLERGDFKASLELAFRLTEFFQLPLSAIFQNDSRDRRDPHLKIEKVNRGHGSEHGSGLQHEHVQRLSRCPR